jgi:hypothetical protein
VKLRGIKRASSTSKKKPDFDFPMRFTFRNRDDLGGI